MEKKINVFQTNNMPKGFTFLLFEKDENNKYKMGIVVGKYIALVDNSYKKICDIEDNIKNVFDKNRIIIASRKEKGECLTFAFDNINDYQKEVKLFKEDYTMSKRLKKHCLKREEERIKLKDQMLFHE